MRAKSQTRRHSFSRCRTPTRVYRPNRARFGPRPSGGTRDRRSGSSSPGPSEGASSRARPRRRASPDFLVAEGENDEWTAASRARRAADARDCVVVDGIASPRVAAHPSIAPARRARVSPVEPRARRVFPARVLDRGVRKRALWRDSHPERPLSTPETRGARLGGTSPASRDVSRTLASATHPPHASAHSIHPRACPPPAWWTRRGHASPRVTTR